MLLDFTPNIFFSLFSTSVSILISVSASICICVLTNCIIAQRGEFMLSLVSVPKC